MQNNGRALTDISATGRHAEPIGDQPSLQPKDGVLVLSGYGVRVAVERGHLVVSDGTGRQQRHGRLHRATAGLKRLVVIGHSGTVSFEALRWLHDVGASFVQLDGDGGVIVASGPSGLDDGRLRRAQALAASTGVGIAIARDLLRTKLEGQVDVLSRLPDSESAMAIVEGALGELDHADTPARLRSVEGKAAIAYWSAWAPVEMWFAKKDQAKIADHWRTFGTRSSPLTGGPRSASTPINALLNYFYAILETEVRLAVLAMGLDPGMGILHADQKSRDSLVFDVIEPLRPVIDGYLLTMLDERTFAAREFFETRQGVCRLMPPLPQALAEMSPRLAKLAAPVVEQVAQRLTKELGTSVRPLTVPTLLTQSNRNAGRDRVRTLPKHTATPLGLEAPSGCRECGVMLEDRNRQHCDACLPHYREAQSTAFCESGRAKLKKLRENGIDPSQTGTAAEKRRSTMQQRRREEAEWDAAHPGAKMDETAFTTEVLPQLQGVSLSAIAEITSLSQQYCSLIRRGLKVPHPRHWQSFKALTVSIEPD